MARDLGCIYFNSEMKIRWLAFLLCISFSAAGEACEVIDDAGHRIKLAHSAQRIVSLAPDLTEILFATGAGKQIVGVMQNSDYPPTAKKIPIVASYNSVDLEKIVTLHPDLIVLWSEGKLAESLRKLNIPIYVSHQKKITDIPNTLFRLGCLAGTEKAADAAALKFTQHYHQLEKKYAQKKKITVFYQVWSEPLMTVSEASWINDVITLCGGRNIFANLKGAAPVVSLETVLTMNPEVIIAAGKKQDWKKLWDKWPRLLAVKKQQLFTLTPDLIERASPRILEGAEEMCKVIEVARNQ